MKRRLSALSSTAAEELVAEIATASKEQAHGINQINSAVTEVDRKIQEAAATAEESAAASEELSKQAQEMKEIVDELIRIIGSGRLQTGSIIPIRFTARVCQSRSLQQSKSTRERGPRRRQVTGQRAMNGHPGLLLAEGDDF